MKRIVALLLLLTLSCSLSLAMETEKIVSGQKTEVKKDSVIAHIGLKDRLKSRIDNFNVSDEIKVFIISMIPIFELRGGIPFGIRMYKLPVWKVVPIAIAGNMLPIFLILLFFDLVTKFCFRIPVLKKILEAIFRRTRKKGEIIEKYEELGLMLFVAIPLPITGAWTGSLAAYLFGLEFWKSILFIFLGVLCASVVVTVLTLLGWIGAGIALVALIVVVIGNIRKSKKMI